MLTMKAQITAEFIIILALASMIFLVTINFIYQERKAATQWTWSLDAQDTAEKLAWAINSAYIAGDGTSSNVTLPKMLVGGVNYTVTVRPRLVTVSVPAYGREYEWKCQTSDIDGASLGLTVAPGVVTIGNSNGTIKLTTY